MSEPEHHHVRFALAVAGVFLAGMLTAVQSRINGQLAHDIGDAFVTSVISFGSGLVLLGAGLVFARAGRAGIRQVIDAVRRALQESVDAGEVANWRLRLAEQDLLCG